MSFKAIPPPGRHCRGLSALDLLLCLAITAILTLAAAPSVREAWLNQRLKAAVAQLHADLAYARSEAIHRAATVIVCPLRADHCAETPAWESGWLVFEDRDADLNPDGGEPRLRRRDPPDGVSITGSAHRLRLRFFPNGTAPGSNARVVFCDLRGAARARGVALSASGRVRDLVSEELAADACAR